MECSSRLRESIPWLLPLVFALCANGQSPTVGQEVDVYFITGQSNGNNFAKEASTIGTTNVGFTLHFARVADTFNDFPTHTGIATSFASSNLDASLATSILATGLQQAGRDIALFTFARNGAGLNDNTTPDGNDWIWYPGTDPANGQLFNDSLYANAIDWNEARLTTLRNAGLTPVVKGMFWFQGEKDGRLLDDDVYRVNFDNLVTRFRQDYGDDLPIVVAQIREIQDSYTGVNQALEEAANADPLVAYVTTEDLEFRANANDNNVHLTGAGHAALAPRWIAAMLDLQATLELVPGDFDDDGDVDADDIDFYSGNLGKPASFDQRLDLNNDGMITLADHEQHVTTLVQTTNGETGALIGDVNLDGIVDVLADAATLVGSLGNAGLGYADGDLNADGAVDVLGDASRLIANLGQSNAQ